MIDLGVHIERVARRLFGDPNKALSKGGELRFGTNGSLSVEIAGPKRGTWYDHENNIGGGVADLLELEAEVKGIPAIIAWFKDELGIDVDDRRQTNGQHIVATYDYLDERGALLFQVVRFGPKKDFRQRQSDGKGGWIWKMAGVRMVPYHLDQLLAAREQANGKPWRVYLCEGEKDVDRVRTQWGAVATCNPGGTGKWRAEFSRYFDGAEVIVLADNDEPGRKHADQVARNLVAIGHQVRLVRLSNVPEKGDISDWIDAGGTQGDLEDVIDAVKPFELPALRRRFPLVRFNDIELSDAPRCIIEDLIPRESLVVVWGPPKCGKSFFVFDLVMHVALGREYRGRRVEQGTVVYIAAEGELGIKARAAAYRQARMAQTGDDPPFYLLTTRLDLVEDLDELIVDIKAQLPDDQCLIIVIDTLNRTIHGSESKDEDMGAYRDAADRLREQFHSAVIIIHHCGTDGSRPRGHTSLTGAVDTQLAVKRNDEGTVLATIEFMKDGPKDDVISCRLAVVDVGFDRDGKAISSCVVEHFEEPSAERRPAGKKLSPAAQRALELLTEAINAGGIIPPASKHIPAGKYCVTETLWRSYCDKGAVSDADTPDAKRMAFKRAAEQLLAAHRVGKWDPWIWSL